MFSDIVYLKIESLEIRVSKYIQKNWIIDKYVL